MNKDSLLISISIFASSLIIIFGIIYLFSNQGTYYTDTQTERLMALADESIDKDDFIACINERRYRDDVEADYVSAISAGAQGTPANYFLYQGKVIYHLPGGVSNLQPIIDELKSKIANGDIEYLDKIEGKDFKLELKASDKYYKDNKDNDLVFLEFSDIDCPACRQFHPAIEAMLASNDDVSYIYRHFPLDSIHPQARKKAEMAECAYHLSDQNIDIYYDYLFKLLKN